MNLSLLIQGSANSCACGLRGSKEPNQSAKCPAGSECSNCSTPPRSGRPQPLPQGHAALSKTTPVRKSWDQPLCKEAERSGPSHRPGKWSIKGGCVSTEPCVLLSPQRCTPLMGAPSRTQAQWRGAWWGVREPRHQKSMARKSLLASHKVQRQRQVPFS